MPREEVEEWVTKALRGAFVGESVRQRLTWEDLPMAPEVMKLVRRVKIPASFKKPYKNVTGNEYRAFSPEVAQKLINCKKPSEPSLPSTVTHPAGSRSTSGGSHSSGGSSDAPALSSGDSSDPDDTFDSNAGVAFFGGTGEGHDARACS